MPLEPMCADDVRQSAAFLATVNSIAADLTAALATLAAAVGDLLPDDRSLLVDMRPALVDPEGWTPCVHLHVGESEITIHLSQDDPRLFVAEDAVGRVTSSSELHVLVGGLLATLPATVDRELIA